MTFKVEILFWLLILLLAQGKKKLSEAVYIDTDLGQAGNWTLTGQNQPISVSVV